MGHIRLGALPRTWKWEQVVELIKRCGNAADVVAAALDAPARLAPAPLYRDPPSAARPAPRDPRAPRDHRPQPPPPPLLRRSDP